MGDYSVSKARRGVLADVRIRKFIQKHSPCKGDCPDRNAVCHIDCEREAKFKQELAAFRNEVIREIKAENMMEDYYMERKYRNSAAKGGKR